MTRRYLPELMSTTLVLSLVACGGGGSGGDANQPPVLTPNTPAPIVNPTTPTTPTTSTTPAATPTTPIINPTTPTTSITSTSTTSTTPASTPIPTPLSYNAKLSWAIPTTRADNTPLHASDLSGYKAYYTNNSGTFNVVPVAGGSTTSVVISGLSSGTYYFAMSAIDSSGMESALTAVVSLTFP